MKSIDVTAFDMPVDHVESVKQPEEPQEQNMAGSQKQLVACFLGIFVFYFYYGVLQEKITKGKYGEGPTEEKFTYTLSLVFVQCIVNALFSALVLGVTKPPPDKTTSKLYIICSLSYLGAMIASNHSLQHVSYPTQVLGKSAKPIPVMVLGVLFARKSYPTAKYFYVLMIVIGVALFMYKDQSTISKAGEESHMIGIGEVLLLISLTLDGVTGATQDRMRSGYQTHAHHMMKNINVWSILWLFIGLVLTGEGLAFMGFVQRFPYVLVHMISFSFASAIGQTFIFITVTTFGPLMCAIMTTTRKFFTILGSIIIFQNPITSQQMVGAGLVFCGLTLDIMFGKEKKDKS